MFSLSGLVVLSAALIGIFSIYKGGHGKTWLHILSVASGATAILCISALPFIFIAAFGSFGGTSSPYEPAFIGYLVLAPLSLVVAIACSLRLVWLDSTLRTAA